ncbi:MAG TPA: FliI/YscN family ATPase [Candidatus Saccharimonadales bacterium]|jgi:flagellum-specific ATP synthase|nr:FliI/YscN family ATPase [Candidatus Saccharimonadales bacterium]
MSARLTPSSSSQRLGHLIERMKQTRLFENRGRVQQVIGLVIESEGPLVAVGEVCRIESPRHDESTLAEVVGFRNHHVLLMPLGEIRGIHPGSEVISLGRPLQAPVGEALLGRVIDGLAQPLDSLGPIEATQTVPLHLLPPHPLKRQRITQPFATGIKALDTFVPCGRGQRLGIFAGSGVGKSTLLGMIASRAEADVNVIALIGERGREVREFLEKDLDETGRRKSVVIVATSNQPALARLRGAFLAMAIAEHFRDGGLNVLLMMDSVTRFAMAQREIGLAVGEPPATRGYTPSVFSLLPQLLERAGTGKQGAITGLFTVLVEADDMNDPIADAVRSILDGHLVLTRELATQNHYPAIDVLESVSRLGRDLTTPNQQELAGAAREMLAIYRKNQDLINIGAYPAGSSAAIDRAIQLHEPLRQFLRQGVLEGFPLAESWAWLGRTMARPAETKPAPAPTAAPPPPRRTGPVPAGLLPNL